MMNFSRTVIAYLRSGALVDLVVRDVLAVIALVWAVSKFKHYCTPGLPSSHEKSLADESFDLGTLLKVYGYRTVGLGHVLPAISALFSRPRSLRLLLELRLSRLVSRYG